MSGPVALRADDGSLVDVDPDRWHGEATAEDEVIQADVLGPVLDVGCGTGRAVVALGRRSIVAMGVDPAPTAVTLARRSGAMALRRSVFDALPGTGRWRTALLLDGNLGIGGDPGRLLRRLRELVAPGGEIVAEVEPHQGGCRALRVRLERGGETTPWFPWAVVGADAVPALAAHAGLRLTRLDLVGARVFARFTSPGPS